MADFGYKIDFARDTEDPGRVFRAMLGLIEFSKTTDNTLIKYLDVEIESNLVLDNIEQGSIIVWLKNILKPVDANQRINAKSICSYLAKAKLDIIKFISNRDTIDDRSELLELQERLKESAKKTDINPLGIYTLPNEKDLLSSLDKFQSANSELQKADKLYYLTRNSTCPVNRNFSLSEESQENLLFKEVIKDEREMILKVKKLDLLGQSKWEFKHGKIRIEAKIADLKWLESFKNRDIVIFPGDAIKAMVEVIEKYDFSGELVSNQYTIKKVIEIIPPPPSPGTQLSFFPDE